MGLKSTIPARSFAAKLFSSAPLLFRKSSHGAAIHREYLVAPGANGNHCNGDVE